MRRLKVALVAAFILSSCGPTADAPNGSSSSATASAAATATDSAIPSPSAANATPGCPTDQPMSVEEYLAADPACFGSANVQVAGWEGYPEGTEGGLDNVQPAWLGAPASDAALRGHVGADPCQPGCGSSSLALHLDPASGLAFEDDSQWVVVTGHRHDPGAAGCTYVPPEVQEDPAPTPPDPPTVIATCAAAFVPTAIEPAAPPAAAVAACPTAAVISVEQFKSSGFGCFHDRTIQVLGYADVMPYVDFGMQVGVKPAWLFLPQDPLAALWSVKPIVSTEVGPTCPDVDQNGPGTCSWMQVQYQPGSGVVFKPSHGWVIVTGRIDDPRAASCVYDWPPNWTDPKTSDSQARRMCRDSFVMTGIRPTTAPQG